MRFVPKDPDAAYWGNMLWLPKRHVPVDSIKNNLTFEVDGNVEPVFVWEDTEHHLIVPREMLSPDTLGEFGFPVYDIRKKDYEEIEFANGFSPRDKIQEKATKALQECSGGVLNLACGRGKSGLALWKGAQLGGPILIIVNNTGTLTQWVEEVTKFLGIPKEEVGLVQGPTFDWERSVCVATIQTLAKRSHLWPREFLDRWKLIIFDEAHHTSAKVFSRTLPLFSGVRLGLTATLEREDGLETIFLYHLGGVVFSDLSQDLPVKVYFQQTPFVCNMQDPAILDTRGEFNIGKFYNYLGSHQKRNDFLAQHVRRAIVSGRKVLGLTHSRENTEALGSLVKDSGVIHGGVSQEKRLEILRNHKAVFATPGCAEEALNDPSLDTIMFFTPYQVWRTFQQGVGRAQRRFEGKKQPVVVLFEDYHMPPAQGLLKKLKKNLKKHKHKFTTVAA